MKNAYILGLLGSALLFFSACSTKEYNRFSNNIDEKTIVTSVSDEDYKKEALFEWKIAKGDRVQITAFNQSSTRFNLNLSDDFFL